MRVFHALRRNRGAVSKGNFAAHYDLLNDFFALVLGPALMYSSALFERAYYTLEQESTHKLERIFTQLAEGGAVTVPLQETFWARRFGAVVDRFGIPWGVNCGESATG